MSDIERLRELKNTVDKISKKTDQALKIRNKLYERILNLSTILNPSSDEKIWLSLEANLSHEMHFLNIIQGGTARGISILKKTQKKLEKSEINSKDKTPLLELLVALIDTMRFTGRNIKAVRRRIKKGIHLTKERSFDDIGEFIKTLKVENKLDKELMKRLRGELERLRPEYKDILRELELGPRAITGAKLAGISAFVAGPIAASILAIKDINTIIDKEVLKEDITIVISAFIVGGLIGMLTGMLSFEDKRVKGFVKAVERLDKIMGFR